MQARGLAQGMQWVVYAPFQCPWLVAGCAIPARGGGAGALPPAVEAPCAVDAGESCGLEGPQGSGGWEARARGAGAGPLPHDLATVATETRSMACAGKPVVDVEPGLQLDPQLFGQSDCAKCFGVLLWGWIRDY